MQTLTITIKPDGSMTVDAAGFVGGKCTVEQDALEAFIQTAGITTTAKDQKKKLEQMYSTAPGNQVKY
jgi:hypothetical protein